MQILKKFSVVVLSLLLIVVPAVIWVKRQDIIDYVRLRNYVPGPAIQAIAERTKMSDYGRKLFYVYHPQLLDNAAFNANCTVEELSIVLGCYKEKTGIYIFDVEEPRLDGVEEVTAAHEMLHVAYERLNTAERNKIDTLTQQTYNALTSERILNTVEAYRDRDPSVVPNELHSIIGTEVRSIPADLEIYYNKYFTNRLAVVELAENYENVFKEREAKIAEYDSRLAALKSSIERLQSSTASQADGISAERARLDGLLESNQVEAYNAAVPGFNSIVRNYNNTVGELKGYINEYNTLVAQRNALVVEEQELIQAIDSRIDTIPTE